jgi:acetyl-CoA carboxylase biotin carboxyl carrier protein
VSDLKSRIDELASLMTEFGLVEGRLSGDGWAVEFSRRRPAAKGAQTTVAEEEDADLSLVPASLSAEDVPSGTPISSPMMGIFYMASSPGASPFVREGDSVVAGQVVGLIEAMKVFNEITATTSGKILKIAANNGQLVQPGDILMYIG